jgi:hypothetical protein
MLLGPGGESQYIVKLGSESDNIVKPRGRMTIYCQTGWGGRIIKHRGRMTIYGWRSPVASPPPPIWYGVSHRQSPPPVCYGLPSPSRVAPSPPSYVIVCDFSAPTRLGAKVYEFQKNNIGVLKAIETRTQDHNAT